VSRVEFRVDGTLVGTDSSSPYAANWNSAAAAAGGHTIQARAYDVVGNVANASANVVVPTVPVVPPADTVAPGPVSTLSVRAADAVALSWANPSDADFASVRILRSTQGFALSPMPSATQVVVYEGRGTSYSDRPSVSATGYYTVFTCDGAGNWSRGITAKAAPVVAVGLVSSGSWTEYGGYVTLRGKLRNAADTPLAGKTVRLQVSSDGVNWKNATTTARTAGSGWFTMRARTYSRVRYRVTFAGDSVRPAASSGSVSVTPKAYLSLPQSQYSVRVNSTISVQSYLKPRHVARTKPVRYDFYLRHGSRWVIKKRVWATASDYSTYTRVKASTTLTSRGSWRVRAFHDDDGHYASYSAYRYFKVR